MQARHAEPSLGQLTQPRGAFLLGPRPQRLPLHAPPAFVSRLLFRGQERGECALWYLASCGWPHGAPRCAPVDCALLCTRTRAFGWCCCSVRDERRNPLKAELKSRGQLCTGNKAALTSRLAASVARCRCDVQGGLRRSLLRSCATSLATITSAIMRYAAPMRSEPAYFTFL